MNPNGGEVLWSRDLVADHGIKLTSAEAKTTAEKVWNNRRLNVDHGNGVLLDGVLYASHRADPAFLVAVDLAAGGKLLLLDEEGELYLARPDDDGSGIVDQISVRRSDAWTVPTLVGKRLYLRDGEQARLDGTPGGARLSRIGREHGRRPTRALR